MGDFYLQSERTAQAKREKGSALFWHCFLYMACMLAAALTLGGRAALRPALLAGAGHFGVDALKFCLRRKTAQCCQGWVLLVDQTLHLTILAAVCLTVPTEISGEAAGVLGRLGWSGDLSAFLRLCCLGLILGKPGNVALKMCNEKPAQRGEGDPPGEADRRSGAVIGTLERMLTAVLFLLGSYGTISVIFAAKTLTRYKRITEEPEFGEYYLIGTLGSMLIAIFASILLFPPGTG